MYHQSYDNLLGYNIKGHKAYPICEENTVTHQLKHELYFKVNSIL